MDRSAEPALSFEAIESDQAILGGIGHELSVDSFLEHHIRSLPRIVIDEPPLMSGSGVVLGDDVPWAKGEYFATGVHATAHDV